MYLVRIQNRIGKRVCIDVAQLDRCVQTLRKLQRIASRRQVNACMANGFVAHRIRFGQQVAR